MEEDKRDIERLLRCVSKSLRGSFGHKDSQGFTGGYAYMVRHGHIALRRVTSAAHGLSHEVPAQVAEAVQRTKRSCKGLWEEAGLFALVKLRTLGHTLTIESYKLISVTQIHSVSNRSTNQFSRIAHSILYVTCLIAASSLKNLGFFGKL